VDGEAVVSRFIRPTYEAKPDLRLWWDLKHWCGRLVNVQPPGLTDGLTAIVKASLALILYIWTITARIGAEIWLVGDGKGLVAMEEKA
jgi:hypothetical protein